MVICASLYLILKSKEVIKYTNDGPEISVCCLENEPQS